MGIPEVMLALLLSTKKTAAPAPQPPVKPAVMPGGAELARTIKTDIESLAGPGSVDVSIDSQTLFSVRVAVPSFRSDVCGPIFDRELRLYRLFPDFSFDFYLRLKQ